MTRYQHLPVFQAIYDFSLEIHRRVGNFPHSHKYALGQKLKKIVSDLIDAVIEANSKEEKVPSLEKAEILLEKLKIHLRLTYDLKIIGHKGFEYLARKLEEIGKQLNKWKEWAKSSFKSKDEF